jgi:hypothetical protein
VKGSPRIIGIHTVPDEDALVQIAGIPPGSTVGIVVDSPEGAHRFTNQIMACNAVEIDVELSTDEDSLREFARRVDVIVCNRSREAQLTRLNLDTPIITLPFHISRQSALRVFDALLNGDSTSDVHATAAARLLRHDEELHGAAITTVP